MSAADRSAYIEMSAEALSASFRAEQLSKQAASAVDQVCWRSISEAYRTIAANFVSLSVAEPDAGFSPDPEQP